MADDFYKTIGIQQTPGQAIAGTSLASPSITPQELIFRSIGKALPPPGSLRYNSPGGAIGMGLLRAFGGMSDTIADELSRQRLDPVQRRMAIAGQLQQMGTKPLAPPTLDPNTTFTTLPEGIEAVPPAPLTPGVGMAGQPTFRPEHLPANIQMGMADIFPSFLDPTKIAQTREAEAGILTKQAQLPLITAQTQNVIGETAERGARTAEIQRQREANDKFRQWVSQADKRSPTFATDMANMVTQLGASNDVVEPLTKTMTVQDTRDFHKQSIDLGYAKIAQDKIEAANLNNARMESLRLGDVNATRQILSDQVKKYEDSLKTGINQLAKLDVAIKNEQGVLSLTSGATPQERAQADLAVRSYRQDRERIVKENQNTKDQLKDAQDRFKEAASMTKAGQALIAKMPPPPPGTEAPSLEGDFLNILGPRPQSQAKFIEAFTQPKRR